MAIKSDRVIIQKESGSDQANTLQLTNEQCGGIIWIWSRVEKCPFASGGMNSERPTTAGQADQLIGVMVGQKDVSEVLDA